MPQPPPVVRRRGDQATRFTQQSSDTLWVILGGDGDGGGRQCPVLSATALFAIGEHIVEQPHNRGATDSEEVGGLLGRHFMVCGAMVTAFPAWRAATTFVSD